MEVFYNPASWTGSVNVVYLDFAAGFARSASNSFDFASVISELCRLHPELVGSEVYVGGKNFGAYFASLAFEDIRSSNSSEVSAKGYIFSLFASEDTNKYNLIDDISQIFNGEQLKNELGLDETDVWDPYMSDIFEQDQFTNEHLIAFTENPAGKFSAVIYGRDITADDLKFE